MFFSLFSKAEESARPAAHDDFWYAALGGMTQSGVRVTPENALKASACYAAVMVFGWPILALCVLGLAESVFNLRARAARRRGPPAPT